MFAILFVFGINIFQFVNVNNTIAPSADTELSRAQFQMYLNEKNQLGNDYASLSDAGKLAALGAANARDGALIDLKDLNQHINSRRLLSDNDYYDLANDSSEKTSLKDSKLDKNKSLKNNNNKNSNSLPTLEKKSAYNLTKKTNESMELVLINGTWHLIDLNVCYNMMRAEAENTNQFYHNNTHLNKINTDLNGWFERHLKLFGMRNTAENPEAKTKYTESQLRNLNANLQKPTYLKDMLEKRALLNAFEINDDKNDASIAAATTTQTARERRLMSNEKRNRPSLPAQTQKEASNKKSLSDLAVQYTD